MKSDNLFSIVILTFYNDTKNGYTELSGMIANY